MEKKQITNNRNERGNMTTNSTDIKKDKEILWTTSCQYIWQISRMEEFVEKYKLSNLI